MKNRAIVLLLFAFSFGCAAATPAVKPAAKPAASEAKDTLPWKTNLLPAEGITIEMPGDAEQEDVVDEREGNKIFYNGLSVKLADAKTTFEVGVYSASNEKEFLSAVGPLDNLRQSFASITREQKIKILGFDGFQIDAKGAKGEIEKVWTFALGSNLYVLSVESTGGNIDERAAARFFDSLRVDFPFRPFVSQYDYFTIATPQFGLFSSFTEDLKNPPGAQMRTFVFDDGVDGAYMFMLLPVTNPAIDREAADELAEGIVMNFVKKNSGVIQQMRPVEINDAPGRDVTFTEGDEVFKRILIAVKNRRVYMAVRFSKDRAKLADRDAQRFFESLTIGRAP